MNLASEIDFKFVDIFLRMKRLKEFLHDSDMDHLWFDSMEITMNMLEETAKLCNGERKLPLED